MAQYRNPVPTVDMIVELSDNRGIVLIKRKNEPLGWALPGGFVDYGESLETAALRETKEELNLDAKIIKQFHAYSDPKRDPRQHTMSMVFILESNGNPIAGDDAGDFIIIKNINELPEKIAFDHKQILTDYFTKRY